MTIAWPNTLNVDYTIAVVTNAAVNASITGNKPSAVVSGDYLEAVVRSYNQVASFGITPPSGWVLISSTAANLAANGCHTWVYYKIAGGSEPSTYSFTYTNGGDTSDDSLIIRRATGVNTASPIGAVGTPTSNTSTTAPAASSITTTANNSVVRQIAGALNGNRLTAANSNYPATATGLIADKTRAFSTGVIYGDAYQAYTLSGTSTGTQTWTSFLSTATIATAVSYELLPYVPNGVLTGINSATTPDTVLIGSSGNTASTTSITAATGMTISSQSMTSFSGSGNSYTFSVPALADGSTTILGSQLATITDGAQSPNRAVTVSPPSGFSQVTLSGTLNTSTSGVLYNFSPAAVAGDIILFMPVPSAGKTTAVDAAGNLDTTLSGTQTMWHIQNSTKIARSYTVTTYANHIPTVSNTTVITDFNTVGHVQLDAADLDSDTLTYSVTTAATHGVGSVNTTGYVTYTPTTGYSGSDSFVVTVSDGKGGTATSTISVTVYPFNIAPVVTSVIVKTVTAQITATDANGDTLTYTVTTQGAFGTASVNSSGLVTYTAGGSFAGKDTFVVTISDGHGGSKTVKFKIRGASSTGSSLSIGIGFGIGG